MSEHDAPSPAREVDRAEAAPGAGAAAPGDAPGARWIASRLGPNGRLFLVATAFLSLLLVHGWIGIFRGALADSLYSYCLLIPFIAAWLVWQRPLAGMPVADARHALGVALLGVALGSALAGEWARRSGWITSNTSWLSTQMIAWVIGVWGIASILLGGSWMVRQRFALAFLIFTIPLPDPAVEGIEHFLQVASAEASAWLFSASGSTYLREGLVFWLPGVSIQVARECSGIRSTLVLFITAVLGSYLLLRSTLHRTAILLAIVPLGIFRNALRILTLTLLSVHVDPEIMNSALHTRGGPLFFAVSLMPLFAMFWWFGRRERPARQELSGPRNPVRPAPIR